MESYINNELQFLSNSFDFVYIIPYHEFSYDETKNRLRESEYTNIKVLKTNVLPSYSIFQRVKRLFDTFQILISEIVLTNQRSQTLKKIKTLFYRIKHYHAIARKISDFVNKDNKTRQIYSYHYWNHDGVIIEKIMKMRFRFRPVKSIARAHSIDLFHNDWPKGFVAFEKIKLNSLDAIFPISQLGLNYLRKKFPKDISKFHLAYLGVPDEWIQFPKFPSKPFKVLTVSNIAEIKRLHLMVEILTHLPKEDFQWIHIGDGIEKYTEPLRRQIESSGINCLFLGHQYSKEIHGYYNQHDILCCINLSYMEGVPVSIMESLMHGIPCIATNVGGTSEMIENDSNGYLVDCNFHPVDVAKKILALSTNETKWNSLSKKAREKYLSHFNSKKNYEDFYQALID